MAEAVGRMCVIVAFGQVDDGWQSPLGVPAHACRKSNVEGLLTWRPGLLPELTQDKGLVDGDEAPGDDAELTRQQLLVDAQAERPVMSCI